MEVAEVSTRLFTLGDAENHLHLFGESKFEGFIKLIQNQGTHRFPGLRYPVRYDPPDVPVFRSATWEDAPDSSFRSASGDRHSSSSLYSLNPTNGTHSQSAGPVRERGAMISAWIFFSSLVKVESNGSKKPVSYPEPWDSSNIISLDVPALSTSACCISFSSVIPVPLSACFIIGLFCMYNQ